MVAAPSPSLGLTNSNLHRASVLLQIRRGAQTVAWLRRRSREGALRVASLR
jgi:hypothetical protein